MRERLQIGLDKLESTAEQVGVMEKELEKLQPVLEKTSVEVEEMIQVITADTAVADETKIKVLAQEKAANEKAAEAKAIADDAQADLDKALPALDAAVQALKLLTKNDIVEVKALKNPPPGVRLVMEVACIFFGKKPKMVADTREGAKPGAKMQDYWEQSTNLVKDPVKFFDSLLTYDKDAISAEIIEKADPYGRDDFEPAAIKKVSKACTSICMWARAMHTYYNVSLAIEPKRAALAEAQASLEVTMGELKEAKETLAGVEAKLEDLNDKFGGETETGRPQGGGGAVRGAARSRRKTHRRARRGEDPVGEHRREPHRETAQRRRRRGGFLGRRRVQRPVHAVVPRRSAQGVVREDGDARGAAHAGRGHPDDAGGSRADSRVEHRGIAERLGVHRERHHRRQGETVAADDRSAGAGEQVGEEHEQGVPRRRGRDRGGHRRHQAQRQGLPAHARQRHSFRSSGFAGEHRGDARRGLEPLLQKQTFKQGGSEVIKMGDDIIPYHPDFRFYITTKMRNPHYQPEVSVKVSLLNFFVTLDGLEDQLLGAVVMQEREDLAEAKNQLVVSNARMKKELTEIEDKILYLLSNATGNILDDEVLIDTLAQSKVTSDGISLKVAEAEATEKDIDETREKYRPVATRASVLFFCISDLALVDPMYQYSLSWFITLFIRGTEEAERDDDVDRRIEILNEYFTYSLYNNICRSLFESHKLMFSLLLTIAIAQQRGDIDAREWRFLLAGPTDTNISEPNPRPSGSPRRCGSRSSTCRACPRTRVSKRRSRRTSNTTGRTSSPRTRIVTRWTRRSTASWTRSRNFSSRDASAPIDSCSRCKISWRQSLAGEVHRAAAVRPSRRATPRAASTRRSSSCCPAALIPWRICSSSRRR